MDNNKFLEKILIFVDREGVVESKNSTPNSSSLTMSYNSNGLQVDMHAFAHGMGNGSCSATVVYKGKTVYKGAGGFTSHPLSVKVENYVAGPWEKLMGL